jgi:hypothetical protein
MKASVDATLARREKAPSQQDCNQMGSQDYRLDSQRSAAPEAPESYRGISRHD